ncbi:MAG TPA: hypothetical protein VE085_11145 [Burkholderiales bacterium]|nr:hypothetical protein [Burkholderiales bacterium]
MEPRSIATLGFGLLALLAAPAWAFDVDRLQNIGQTDFRLLSEDLGAALSYHPQTPTEPLGITGFDVGASITMSKLANKDAIARGASGSVPSYLPVPTLRANKGLPLGFDVGLMYSKVPGTDISLWGGEARWAFLRGGIAEPAVGVRATYTKLTGVDQLDMSTKGLDISASKGFLLLTPYIGVGRTWVTSTPHVANLGKEDFALNKFFIGAGFKLLLFNMNAEVDRTGESTAYSLKAGIRF